MKLFGSLKELVSVVFRKNTKEITVQPSATTYNVAQTISLPPPTTGLADLAADTLVGASAQQTLANKLIDGNNNVLSNVGYNSLNLAGSIVESDLKTTLADASKAILRDGSGAVVSALIADVNVSATAAISGTKIQAASAIDTGVITTGAQTLAGVKTFSSNPIMSGLTASQAVVTDGSKNLSSLGYSSTNTASNLVQRDSSGNFSAGTVTASSLSGPLTGTVGAATPNTGAFTTLSSTQSTNLATTSGNVGIGTSSPGTKLEAVGVVHVHDSGTVPDNTYVSGIIRSTRPAASGEHINITRKDNVNWAIGTLYNTNTLAIGQSAGGTDSAFTYAPFVISGGNVGIGQTNPTNLLEVGGWSVHQTLGISGQSGAGFLEFAQQNANPATPGAGYLWMYAKTDKNLYYKDETGTESLVGAGGTLDIFTQASSFAVGDVLYLSGSTYVKADASSASTGEVVGVISKIITAGQKYQMTLAGEISGVAASQFTEGVVPAAGAVVFLSTTPGKMTITEPSVIGQVSVPLGISLGGGGMYFVPKRGTVLGGTNARTQISLSAVTTAQTIYTAPSGLDAGELTGWVYLDATTDKKFYVSAPFAKNGAGTDWNISPSYVGDTPPAGFSMTMTSGGLIQITMNPLPTGFVSGYINYALNAPAVGATFPLAVDASTITTGTVAAARLPEAGASASGIINQSAQTFAGVKTFNNGISLGNETLSVYDEGVWTPTLTFGGNAVGMTYSKQIGAYTRIGNRCFFNCYILLSARGSSIGAAVIGGLPFVAATEANGGPTPTAVWSNGVSVTSGVITCYVAASTQTLQINYTTTGANSAAAAAVTEGYFSTTASIMISGSYVVA